MVILVVLGMIPFALGGFMNWFMMANPDMLPSTVLIGVVTLLMWTALAFFVKPYINDTKKVIIGLNSVALAILIPIGIQELLLQAYWPNLVGVWTQFYYLPLLNIGLTLTSWSHSVFSAYCASFLLMVIATALGCKLRKK